MRPFALPLLLTLALSASAAPVVHVSPGGSDANPGSEAAPVASFTAARDLARKFRAAEGKTSGAEILFHPGTYLLSESMTLNTEDSGMPESPFLLKATEPGAVRIIGGQVIPASAFQSISDATDRARLDPAVVDSVRVANLEALGITNLGDFPDQFSRVPSLPELFFNGERMTLARWPNEGWAEIKEVIESGPAPWRNHASEQLAVFEYDGDRPARWKNAPAVWVHGYWCFDWASETIRVDSIDLESHRIKLAKDHVYGLGSGNPAKRRYCATNLLEELDAPGEYFIDRDRRLLFFLAPAPLDQSEVVLTTLTDPLLAAVGVSHLHIKGLTFDGTAGDAINLTGGENNLIAGCTFRNSGLAGVVIEGGTGHTIQSSEIYNTGTSGIRISGGNRKTLAPSGHRVTNNHLHHISRRQRTAAYHIELGGVGIHVDHNLIHDAPHQSILLAGNDHRIELNEVHHTSMDSDDCGAFYMGRNPSERGNVIRHNFWHHIGSSFNHGSCAVYFDDGTGGQLVEGNIFFRAAGGSFGAVFLHGGHDNRVEGNLFIDCKRAIGHAPWDDAMWTEWLGGELWTERLRKEVDITSPTYTDRYPELLGYFESASRPRINYATNNVLLGCGSVSSGNWDLANTSVRNDIPKPARGESPSFDFLSDPAWWKQFPQLQPIPFDQIGLVTDEYRLSANPSE